MRLRHLRLPCIPATTSTPCVSRCEHLLFHCMICICAGVQRAWFMAGPSLWFDMWFQSTCPNTFLPPERDARTRTLPRAAGSRRGIRDFGALVRPLPPHPARAHVHHLMIFVTFPAESTLAPRASSVMTCARTHVRAAWGATCRSAIVFGLPGASRLGGKTWRQASA